MKAAKLFSSDRYLILSLLVATVAVWGVYLLGR